MNTKENESMRSINRAEAEEFSAEDFINELDLESLVITIPNPEAVKKLLEIEMHIEPFENEEKE